MKFNLYSGVPKSWRYCTQTLVFYVNIFRYSENYWFIYQFVSHYSFVWFIKRHFVFPAISKLRRGDTWNTSRLVQFAFVESGIHFDTVFSPLSEKYSPDINPLRGARRVTKLFSALRLQVTISPTPLPTVADFDRLFFFKLHATLAVKYAPFGVMYSNGNLSLLLFVVY